MITRKSLLLIVLTALTALLSGADLPKILEYRLDLRIDFSTEKLYGKCGITILNDTEIPVSSVPVLLYRLLTVKSVRNGEKIARPFTQNVISITRREKVQVNFIEISLDRALLPGEQTRLELEYEGYLLGYAEAGWRYVKDHISKDFTIMRTDGYGYPIIAYPDEREMMSIFSEKFDYLINITVPKGMTAVTAGELISRTETGDESTFTFRSRKPSFRMDIAISDYRYFDSGQNRIGYFPDDSAGAQAIMNALVKSLEIYENWFGRPDSYRGYTIIEVPEGYGSQADVCAMIISADNFKKRDQMYTIYHEAAHLWNVSNLESQPCRFESEGFAQFMQLLVYERLDNRENSVSEAAQGYVDRIRKTFTENPEFKSIPVKDYGVKDMTQYSY